jgi:hypothetical protein
VQALSFVNSSHPTHGCKLQKSLYNLKQTPRPWYKHFATYSCALGFKSSTSDTSLLVLFDGTDVFYLLLYIDGIIITASSNGMLSRLIRQLHGKFARTDLGDLHFFLITQVTSLLLFFSCHNTSMSWTTSSNQAFPPPLWSTCKQGSPPTLVTSSSIL